MYILGPDGKTMTETDGSGNWTHTDVSANGELVATYANDGQDVHFQFAVACSSSTSKCPLYRINSF